MKNYVTGSAGDCEPGRHSLRQADAVGLVPGWAKDETVGGRLINARVETLKEKAAFRDSVQSRRCLIPADGFYEWRREGNRKVPIWFYLKSKEPFGFAGLWDVWHKPDGRKLETFTIITSEPNPLVRPVHDRMPAILRPEDEEQWLDVAGTPSDQARLALKPYPWELMAAHDVAFLVNRPENDSAECIKPADHGISDPQLILV